MGTLQNRNQILFISSTTDSNGNIIKINSYNIETKQISNPLHIECNDYDIDIKHCSYCLDNKNNKIYLINNNKQIIAISMNNKTLKLINTINTQQQEHKINDNNNNIPNVENSNFATITYRNNKVMIFGAISEHKDDDNVMYIPFDLKSQQKHNKQEYAIQEFGKNTNILNVETYTLLLGGVTSHRQNRDNFYPTNAIWRCQLYINSMLHIEYQWDGQYYLPESMHSFGVINLDLDDIRYIVTFGGTHIVKNRNSNIYEEQPMRTIYALYLNKKHENVLMNQYNDNKQEEQENDHGTWLELDCKLPKRSNFYAIYDKHIDAMNIHLISYGGTRCVHYIVLIDDIKHCLMNKQYDVCPPWIEKGKTTQSVPIGLDIKSQKIDLPNNTMLSAMKGQTSKQSMECSTGIYAKHSRSKPMETVQSENIDQDVLDPVVIDEMKEIAEQYIFDDTNWSRLVTSCPNGNGADAGSGKTARNYSNNNDRKTQRDNNNNNDVNNGGGDVGGNGGRKNGRDDGDDGDDEKKRDDKYKDMITDNDEDKEEEEEEDDDEDEEGESEYKLNANAPSFTPKNTLPPIFERICKEKEKSKGIGLNIMKTTTKKKVPINKKKPIYCYEPRLLHRAQGNIVISRKLTECVIPRMICEDFNNLWEYMNKTTAIEFNNIFIINNGSIKIINYSFHDKNIETEILYAVIECDDNMIWRMKERLYFCKELENEYGIYCKQLPKTQRTSTNFILQLSQIGRIRNLIMNKNEIKKLIKKIKWNKLPIKNKKENRKRMTLSIDKQEFIKNLINFVDNIHNDDNKKINLIPILLFNQSMNNNNNDDENIYRIEHIWIVQIDINISIGISFVYNKQNKSVFVTGIHLDRTYISNHHDLVLPHHDCHCLDNFKSYIDDLHIGHPDDNMNSINNLPLEIKKRDKELKKLRKMQN